MITALVIILAVFFGPLAVGVLLNLIGIGLMFLMLVIASIVTALAAFIEYMRGKP